MPTHVVAAGVEPRSHGDGPGTAVEAAGGTGEKGVGGVEEEASFGSE